MRINLHNIVPGSLESDIKKAGGDKIQESFYQIQYFDYINNGVRKFSIPKKIPNTFSKLFCHLKDFSEDKKTLEKQKLSLFMKEAYDECALVLYSNNSDQIYPSILCRIEFEKSKWGKVEDLLLSAGLAVFRRNETRTFRYSIKEHSADYELVVVGNNATLTLSAPDDMRFVKSLMVIGQSIK